MMNEREILSLIRNEVAKAFRAPGIVVNPDSIAAIAKRVAHEVMEPQFDYAQTTDATETEIKNITVEDGETGLIEIKAIGIKDDGTESNTVVYLVKYHKTGGALTITSLDSWSDLDTAGAAVSIVDDGTDNISIRVTGAAATTIDWDLYVEQQYKIATALP
jgi:hypothetical protein